MRDLTPEEIAELSERIKAGDVRAIDTARKATKPAKPARVPAVPADPRVTGIKRQLTRLGNLHAELMTAKRYISDLRAKCGNQAIFRDEQAGKYHLLLMNSEAQMHNLLETFLGSLRRYFNGDT